MAAQAIVFGGLGVGAAYGAYQLALLATSDCDLETRSKRVRKSYFRDRVVWITGASSGIGKQLARELDALDVGVRLVLSARNRDALQSLADELRCDCAVVPVDLSDLDSLDDAAETAQSAFGRVDILFNNGGISTRSFAEDTQFSVDLKVMTVDALAHIKLAKLLLPGMIARRRGHFVNTSSLAGKLGAPMRSAYCAAKFAVMGHFDALRIEVRRHNVRVTNVCPGSVQTDVARNALTGDGARFGAEDANIAQGMSVRRCAKLMLAATSNDVQEMWCFGSGTEKLAAYASAYVPGTFRKLTLARADALVAKAQETMAAKK